MKRPEPKYSMITFDNTGIHTVKLNSVVYVGLKQIVERLGLDWSTQQRKVKAQSEKYGCKQLYCSAVDSKNRMITCIQLDRFESWLFSINADKVNPDLKPRIEFYQKECSKVLHNYWTTPRVFEVPKTYKEALLKIVEQIDKTERLESKNSELENRLQEQKPLIEFAETVSNSGECLCIREFAKILSNQDFNIGEKRLFKFFYRYKVLISNTEPYQKYIDQDYLVVVQRHYYSETDQKRHIYNRVYVTPKGQIYFTKKVKEWIDIKAGCFIPETINRDSIRPVKKSRLEVLKLCMPSVVFPTDRAYKGLV